MRLQDDDLYDSYDDSFDEDAAVDEVVDALKPYTLSPDAAAAELDKLDWDIDAAIASLKKKHAKQVKQTKQVPKPNGKLPEREQAPEKPSLAALASQRKADKSSAKLSLAELAAQRKSLKPETKKISGLDRLKVRPKQSEPKVMSSPVLSPPKPLVPAPVEVWEPQISYELPHVNRAPKLSALEGIVSRSELVSNRTETNYFAVSSTAKNAFAKPSPDDVVLNAQTEAFAEKPVKPKPKPAKPVPKRVQDKSGLVAKLNALKLKPACSFVVIGHVDAGKSTLMGRLLLETGALTSKAAHKQEHESTKAGKGSFWLAWAMDATTEERERGVTVDISEAQFETAKARFTILDAPGHRDYVPNMISGVSQADIAVLVVDSDTNAFESGFSLDGQTKEHAVLARSLGLERIIVAVNKMDMQSWDEDRFEDIKAQLTDFLRKKVGFELKNIEFIPTSGIEGKNVYKEKQALQSDGKDVSRSRTLVEALEDYAVTKKSDNKVDEPFRFIVSNAYSEPFQSTLTVFGRAVSGVAEKGDVLELVSGSQTSQQVEIKEINTAGYITSGEQSEIQLVCQDEVKNSIHPGSVLTTAGDKLKPVAKFTAKVRIFDISRPVLPGTKLGFHLGRVDTSVKISKIIESIDLKKKPDQKPARIRHLGKGSAALVELELEKPEVLATPEVCKALSRFVLRLNGSTIGGGVVANVDSE